MNDEGARNFRSWLKRIFGDHFQPLKISLYDRMPKAIKQSLKSVGSSLWWPLWQKKIIKDLSNEKDLPLSAVKRLHLVVGQRCNQHCVMCTSRDDSVVMNPSLYITHLKPLYEHLEECIIQGGEPTIIKDARQCFDYIAQQNEDVRFSMMTNGRAFDEEWQKRFVQRGKSVNFSINAATETTYRAVTKNGDWHSVLENLNNLVQKKEKFGSRLKITVSFVIITENKHEMFDFAKMALHLGCNSVRFFHDSRRLPEHGFQEKEQIQAIFQLGQEHNMNIEGLAQFEKRQQGKTPLLDNCDLPFRALFVHADGRVSFCCHMRDYLGNVFDSPIKELWNSPMAKYIRSSFREQKGHICKDYCSP